jgi:hypothetical protein
LRDYCPSPDVVAVHRVLGSLADQEERGLRKPKYDFQMSIRRTYLGRAVTLGERWLPRQEGRSCQRFRLFPSSTMIRAQGCGVPFIFIPAFSDETTRARALQRAQFCFLSIQAGLLLRRAGSGR